MWRTTDLFTVLCSLSSFSPFLFVLYFSNPLLFPAPAESTPVLIYSSFPCVGNCFEIEEWGSIESSILAKHFEHQGKSPYAYHAYLLDVRDTIGAFINVEASGTGGFDLVCQSGPGSWPSYVYAQSAVYPMANSAAQDIFGAVQLGDTDYKIFAKVYGDIPGLDMIFLLGGYFYHTSDDQEACKHEGDNMFSLMKAFANSSKLLTAQERESLGADASGSKGGRSIFFDYFANFLVIFSRKQALIVHTIPFAIFLLMPLLLRLPTGSLFCSFSAYYDFIKGLLFHANGIILAIVLPMVFSVLRLLFSGHSMNWHLNNLMENNVVFMYYAT